MKKTNLLFLFVCFFASFCLFVGKAKAQNSYFFPKETKFNPAIPTPEQFLGYPIGKHHTRYDQIISYFKELDRVSDRISSEIFGMSIEYRPQIVLKITSPANHARIEEIRKANLARSTQNTGDDMPMIMQINANVHGNEPSGGEAAIMAAYYLAASESEETLNWLNNMVILLDPIQNPDGRDRFVNWANMHKGTPFVSDPLDREHNEVWPGGRMNHYWFDPNRDWFLGIHPESRNRMKLFHQWRPYVFTDHHEMGTNSSFYFDPGMPSSNNWLIPKNLAENIHIRFAKYFEKGMNDMGSMYFTKEVFDKLYPGYGSSYANFYGGMGLLFEQASSRGHIQETTTIPITFEFTIRNQLAMALATIRATLGEKTELIKHRREFFKAALDNARKSPIKGYIFGDSQDENRTNALANLLLMHEIEFFEVENEVTLDGKKFEKGKSFIVPTEQTNYVMVQSVFEKNTKFIDSVFYDASAWSLVHAFGMPFAEVKTPLTKGKQVARPKAKTPATVEKSTYAYLIDWVDYYAPKALYHLLNEGAVVQTAFKPFAANVGGKERKYGYGTLVIPVQQQKISADSLFRLVQKVSKAAMLDVQTVSTGYNLSGIDLGSGNVRTVKKPEALMIVGAGVSAYEAGEVWHLLDERIGMPITKIEMATLSRANLSKYNTIVMVSAGGAFLGGGYNAIDENMKNRLKSWLASGGTLITLKSATEWAIRQGLTKEKLKEEKKEESKDKKEPKMTRLDFDKAQATEGAKGINGSIFEMDLDTSHPIGFGYTNRKISVYKNGTTMLEPSTNPYNTIGQYTPNPLINGYISKENLKKLGNNTASILVSSEGAGRIVMFADNPNFRGTWYGTNKLFLNALFLGSLISSPNFDGGEATDE
ncbi:MAG: zinc carboxypeptidase [Cytophagales bacterium]|nr:MAG: zinc carboxypeptidase [Cytophagales bacterium]